MSDSVRASGPTAKEAPLSAPSPTQSVTGTRLLTVDEAAMMLHVSRSTIYRMIRAERLSAVDQPAHSSGRDSTRIPKWSINAYIQRLREESRA